MTLAFMLGILAITIACLIWGISSAEKQDSQAKKG